jgi:hypothetical protein
MNERIEDLERQAEKFVMGIPASLDINEYTSVFNEKFAELIVRKCLELAHDEHKMALEYEWDNDDTATSIRESISKHFGVEE